MNKEIIQDVNEYTRLRAEYARVFREGANLPEMVFRDGMKFFYFFEYGYSHCKGFVVGLLALSRRYQDERVNWMSIRPDAAGYITQYSHLGLASFDIETLSERFLAVMFTHHLVANGNVFVLWGSSLKWGIFCNREDFDMCVIGTTTGLDKVTLDLFSVLETSVVVPLLVNYSLLCPEGAARFAADWKKNYPGFC